MTTLASKMWWAIVIRGLCALVFGILCFVWPIATIGALVFLFAAYALIDGVFAIVSAFTSHEGSMRWFLLLEGVFGIAAGILTFAWPGITAFVLLYFIAGWAIITGILEIIAAIRLREVITGEWLLILSGIASVIFGVLLFLYPGAGALAVITIIGAYAVVFGILLLVLGFRLRGHAQKISASPAHP
jgi:uncharacterized membrane protein HdeD (DUF308 family)